MAALKDIAEEAGVSIMAVSNVVNGKFTKVSKKNTETIQRLVQKYRYVPNPAARALSICFAPLKEEDCDFFERLQISFLPSPRKPGRINSRHLFKFI